MPKAKWTCKAVKRKPYKTSTMEVKQRLAQVLELLLEASGQLKKDPTFSKNSDFLASSEPLQNSKESA